MSDSDVYQPSASSMDGFDILYLSSKEELEVANTIQPCEGELRTTKTVSQVRCLGEDLNKYSWYPMFSLLRLCFVFRGKIYVKNG